MTGVEHGLAVSPLVPWPAAAALVALAAAGAALALGLKARGAGWRAVALAALAAAILNPTLVREEREPRKDVAVVVVDESPSQGIGDRPARTEAALAALEGDLSRFPDLEVRVVRAGGRSDEGHGDGTRLFAALGRALADVPRRRVAGAVLITDGQVHDAPPEAAPSPLEAPLHVLLTGRRGERDRRLVVEQAPRFGLVGREAAITVRVEDEAAAGGLAEITVRGDAGPPRTAAVPVGVSQTVTLPLDHRGENVFELEVAPGEREMTPLNNRAVVAMSGVRERLRVLLVSGQPYPGERVWRNLLKSDPSVDLVHFTILRPPEKRDDTPVQELSLISFPIQELFEAKLHEFDLVIFDHYRRRGLLPQAYLDNIVRYVRDGGAVLEAAGPFFASVLSLFRTPLGAVLPGAPTGEVLEEGFRPRLTAVGRRHPVASDLALTGAGPADGEPEWGRWFRQVEVEARRGDVLMSGIRGRPLVILDRVGDGRVAQVLSDQIWLWARGFEGGGPQAELLRRLAHWLMKEPELEEEALTATVRGDRMEIVRRSLEPGDALVTVTAPSGAVREVPLGEGDGDAATGGRASAEVTVDEIGLYRLSDGVRSAVAAVGSARPLEFADVRATAERLRPAVEAAGGGVVWLGEEPAPEVRRVRRGGDAFGRLGAGDRPWIGFLANRDYVVTGLSQTPLVPAIAMLALALAALALAWRREGL